MNIVLGISCRFYKSAKLMGFVLNREIFLNSISLKFFWSLIKLFVVLVLFVKFQSYHVINDYDNHVIHLKSCLEARPLPGSSRPLLTCSPPQNLATHGEHIGESISHVQPSALRSLLSMRRPPRRPSRHGGGSSRLGR